MKLDFVRGHMGGNLIVLIPGEQMPVGLELETAIKLLGPNYLYGHEMGILYSTGKPYELAVKIAEPISKCFISACGGLTQVLGAALIDTGFGEMFGIQKREPLTEVILHTAGGSVKLEIEVTSNKAGRVKTGMKNFVEECYDRGVRPLQFNGLEIMQAGKFLVINADRFKELYPWADFMNWDQETMAKVVEIQNQFIATTGEDEYNVVLYDWNSEHGADLRAVYPHAVAEDYFEPSCGTGTVALGIAALFWGELPWLKGNSSGSANLKVECGGGNELGGPEMTELDMTIENGFMQTAALSHSNVEVTSVGEVWL